MGIKTIKSSGGDYSLLSTWESNENVDLVAAASIATAECYSFAMSDSVTIAGGTVNSSYYARIVAASGNGHTGTPGTGFRVSGTADYVGLIHVGQQYTRIENIEVTNNSSTYGSGIRTYSNTLVDGCIVKTGTATGTPAIAVENVDCTIRNNLCYDSGAGIGTNGSTYVTGTLLYNNTCVDCTYYAVTLNDGCSATAINNVEYGCTNFKYLYGSGSFTGSSDYNAGHSSTSSDIPGTTVVTSLPSSAFNNYASNDFSPSSGGALKNGGTTIGSFSTDAIGTSRPQGASWDLGFIEYIEAAGGQPTSLRHSNFLQGAQRFGRGF